MSDDFHKDLKLGDLGERMWSEHLRSLGHKNVSLSPKSHAVYWDVQIDDLGIRFEVKYDIKAWYWARKQDREPNLFLEFWSNTKGKECGILIVEADYLVYIIEELPHGVPIAYLFEVEQLVEHLRKASHDSVYRVTTNRINGNDNVKGWVTPVSEITKKSNGFIKTITLQNEEINRI